jgi:hypothetical protein
VLLWAASVLWAYRDIRSRSDDVSVQVLAAGLVLCLPFVGIPLHLILRPRETLAQKYERTLQEEYLHRDVVAARPDIAVGPQHRGGPKQHEVAAKQDTKDIEDRAQVCEEILYRLH